MSGITTNTQNGLLYGTNGYMTVDGTDLGATRGEFQVEWSLEMYYPDLAQALGPVSGTGRVIKGEFRLRATLTEWTYAILSRVMGSYGVSSEGTSERIGSARLGPITEVDNVVLTGIRRNDNKGVRITIPRAYVQVGNLTISKSQETGVEVTFEGLYTAANPERLPGYIEIEK